MGINISWENERNDKLEKITDSKNYFGSALKFSSLEKTACLRFIDPYGDTVFNQKQIPILIDEIQALFQFITPEKAASLQEKLRAKLHIHNVPPEIIEIKIENLSADKISEHINKILDLARRSNGNIHTYLKFYGE
jgi:hypothetical protein